MNTVTTTASRARGAKTRCRHCGKVRHPAGRGLCWCCYRDRGVRAEYLRFRPGPRADGGEIPDDREPTADELEATIAAQRECLPDWWEYETQLDHERARLSRTYTVVRCD